MFFDELHELRTGMRVDVCACVHVGLLRVCVCVVCNYNEHSGLSGGCGPAT